MSNEKYVHQFKTMDDLRAIIKEFEGALARPTRNWSHPTLYRKRDAQEGDKLVQGVRKKDWLLSEDEKWVLPHNQMGLSFSSHWQHLKGVYKMKQKHNPGFPIHVYWVLEQADLPPGLKFESDHQKKGHYLLTVTEKILVHQLVAKLRWVADRMSVIKDAGENL
ncbi:MULTISPECIES: hypothetical protein [unclassified Microbulbifer]|uniref:hypothetical protein n=1 Tax=unclassified Microbulbifer TaxID=2619833 RepID=UPI0027E508ED|nr:MULTISPECIES: hypothetical protein [unclassified Microbulbifer]